MVGLISLAIVVIMLVVINNFVHAGKLIKLRLDYIEKLKTELNQTK